MDSITDCVIVGIIALLLQQIVEFAMYQHNHKSKHMVKAYLRHYIKTGTGLISLYLYTYYTIAPLLKVAYDIYQIHPAYKFEYLFLW